MTKTDMADRARAISVTTGLPSTSYGMFEMRNAMGFEQADLSKLSYPLFLTSQ